MKYLNPLPYISLILMLFLGLLAGCINDPEEPEGISLAPGDRCPEFQVTLLDGSVISTGDLAGHTSLIVLFNTSCGDCRRELPVIEEVYGKIRTEDKDVIVLCISREQDKNSVETYWKENSLTLPVSPQSDRKVYNLFASSVIPRIYIVSPTLLITAVWSDNPLPSVSDLMAELNF